jgi:C4-dicarboxylate-specific signal transduction histidine kinase
VSTVEGQKESVRLCLRPDQLAHLMHREIASELLVGFLHELNQPLTAMAMLVSSASEAARATADSRLARVSELLSKIELQTTRACEITRRLRQASRRIEPRRVACDPNLIVKQALGLSSADIRACQTQVQLGLNPAARGGVSLDVAQIRQVILSLLRNALESLEGAASSPRILEVSTTLIETTGDRWLALSISDNGVGVPPELEYALFEPFVTSKPDHPGLGLAISRSIVQAHGGRLSHERPDNGGARFVVMLPCHRQKGAADGN